MGRAALDALARPLAVGDVGHDLGAQGRDMLAPALWRGGLRRRPARRPIAFEPALGPSRAPLRPARLRRTASAGLARPALASLPFALPLGRRLVADDQACVKIGVRLFRELHAQLIAQHARAHFHDLALGEVAKLERAEGNTDQAVNRQTQVLEDLLDLPVFPFPEAQGKPGVRALLAVKLGLDAEIIDAVNRDPASEPIERRLVDAPVHAHPVAAQPAGRRKLQNPREAAVVGEQQKPFGVDVEATDCDHARQVRREHRENRVPPLRVARGGDEAPRLVKQKEPRALWGAEPLAVDAHVVGFAHIEGGA